MTEFRWPAGTLPIDVCLHPERIDGESYCTSCYQATLDMLRETRIAREIEREAKGKATKTKLRERHYRIARLRLDRRIEE